VTSPWCWFDQRLLAGVLRSQERALGLIYSFTGERELKLTFVEEFHMALGASKGDENRRELDSYFACGGMEEAVTALDELRP
jgi:hypothetical protein